MLSLGNSLNCLALHEPPCKPCNVLIVLQNIFITAVLRLPPLGGTGITVQKQLHGAVSCECYAALWRSHAVAVRSHVSPLARVVHHFFDKKVDIPVVGDEYD